MPSYGLIVEGEGDQHVFENLIKKVNSPDSAIYPLPCGGVGRLMKEFPALLKRFEYIHNLGPVDGALVIRDADNKSTEKVLAQMREKLQNKTYKFPHGVELCCVNRKVDTWLLADETAINEVSRLRGGKPVQRINQDLEDIVHPKELLQKILSAAKLKYSPAVLGEIAACVRLEQLETRVPSFKHFKRSVLRVWGKMR